MSADDQRSTLDVKGIISLIPNLTQFVADVIAISNPNPQTPAASTTDGQLVSAIPSGRRHGGISSSGTQSNAPNREAGDDEGRHPMVTEDNYRSLYNQVDKLFRDLKHVERSLQRLVSLEESVGSQFGTLVRQSRELEDLLKVPTISPQNGRRLDASKLQDTDVLEKFRSLNNMVTQIQDQIPFISFLEDYQCSYESLSGEAKSCLLCFSVFAENTVVRKRLLAYWWIGEGFVDPKNPGDKTVDGILRELMGKGFVEPLVRKRRIVGFMLNPLVRFAVIKIAEEKGFLCFDEMGVPTGKISPSSQVCLTTKELEEPSRLKLVGDKTTKVEQLQTMFNVNDPFPDFKAKWFSKLRNLLVLHLGCLQDSAEHHIEVEDTDFLKGLKNMKRLKYLSLQGISRIVEIPGSVCSLSSLRVLDLNSCHNMELLPKSMGTLKQLTHLDLSGCYLLDHIPKELNLLTELQVLKGFIIGSGAGDACLLEDLIKLKRLKKFSIITSREDFPRGDELNVLLGFVALTNLDYNMGHKKKHENSAPVTSQKTSANWDKERGAVEAVTVVNKLINHEKMETLEKLELRCFPELCHQLGCAREDSSRIRSSI
ncbi:hypothetical protein MLD38_027504 [Melastoma candidum]|uniref:Uncharacterized protein n=1 Tax=Melastoma candidum TaxID=119954 RepID=A0ACB9P1R9_9MYRT|nr:hypothetical protein MLD38_027504 [Melastoma candidum]